MIDLVVIVVTSLLYGGSASAASDLTHDEVLDENEDFVLSWTFDDEQIEFEARGKTRGWLGLGLSPNGGMPGSDIAIGWVKDGQATADHSSKTPGSPSRPLLSLPATA
ncbi:Hypp8359 [Branchiostoma lanceolatum]|uniref:Hypp8359 protein n=1 Tax=Branchiostoma lanceolatum TaxID=7740 RepID=A0A8J9Z7U0_BRALA|nr:Hypp8359 [Branchiostoma lanceolatum]